MLSPGEQIFQMWWWVLRFLVYCLAVQLRLAVGVLYPCAGQCQRVALLSVASMKFLGVKIQSWGVLTASKDAMLLMC